MCGLRPLIKLKIILLILLITITFVSFSPYLISKPVHEAKVDEEGLYHVWFGTPFPFMRQPLPIGPLPEDTNYHKRAELRGLRPSAFNEVNYLASILVIFLPVTVLYLLFNKFWSKSN